MDSFKVCAMCAFYARGSAEKVTAEYEAHVCQKRGSEYTMTAMEEASFINNSLRRMGLREAAVAA